MRMNTPRIAPLDEGELPEEMRIGFGDGPVLNIFRTLARHPELAKRCDRRLPMLDGKFVEE